MRYFMGMFVGTVLLVLANGAFSFDYGFRVPICDYGFGYGPGSGMMQNRGDGFGYGRENMTERLGPDDAGIGPWVFYYIPEIRNIMDGYHLKMQKIFLEAKEARLKYDQQRRELLPKLDNAVEKYKTDKTDGKEVVSILREFRSISDKIRTINNEAMKKIKDLNDQREIEINKAVDNWLKRMEGDEKELQRFVDYYADNPGLYRNMGYKNFPAGRKLKNK